MKKKILVLFALLLAATLLLAACGSNPSVNDLQEINDLLKIKYSKIEVRVNTKTDVAELNGSFTLTFNGENTNIDYTFDRINDFEIGSDGSVTAPDGDFMVTEKGTVVVREGKIIQGETVQDLPIDELTVAGFSFKQAFFNNATLKKAKFEADVINPQQFTGNVSLNCKNMHVVVIRNLADNVLTSIELTYTTQNGSEVKINYLFTK